MTLMQEGDFILRDTQHDIFVNHLIFLRKSYRISKVIWK